jgi:hypothetical protein
MIRSSHYVDAHLWHVHAVQNGLGPVKHIAPCHRRTVLSGIYVCGPSVNSVPSSLDYDILGFCASVLQFALAVGRFAQHAPEMR